MSENDLVWDKCMFARKNGFLCKNKRMKGLFCNIHAKKKVEEEVKK